MAGSGPALSSRCFGAPRSWMEGPILADPDAENACVRTVLALNRALERQLLTEMPGRLTRAEPSVPEARGPWEYCTRSPGTARNAHCSGRPRGGGPKQVLLDENALAWAMRLFPQPRGGQPGAQHARSGRSRRRPRPARRGRGCSWLGRWMVAACSMSARCNVGAMGSRRRSPRYRRRRRELVNEEVEELRHRHARTPTRWSGSAKMRGGHAGWSERFDSLEDYAIAYAFALATAGTRRDLASHVARGSNAGARTCRVASSLGAAADEGVTAMASLSGSAPVADEEKASHGRPTF